MHDLRRKIYESGKTTSRKAARKADSRPESTRGSAVQSPIASPSNSRPSSRPGSRPGSRYASEDEIFSDSDVDDGMTLSTNSASDMEAASEIWPARLEARIEELQDRKRSSAVSRVETLNAYIHLLRYHFAESQVRKSVTEILPPLMTSIKKGRTSEEQMLAMKALAVTTLTCPADNVYDVAFQALKAVCEDAEDEEVKAEAIYTMGVVTVYGGAGEPEMEELLEFLTEVTGSDGHQVNAPDSAVVVTAAMQIWAFVATNLDSLAAQSDQAIDAFVGQLDSTDADVQTTAGANIALLFEVSRQLEEEDAGELLNLQVDPKYLIKRMGEISRGSKSISRKNRRHVRSNFASIITSLERGKGPGWSTAGRPASNPNTGGSMEESSRDGIAEFGYREKIKVDSSVYVIESWATMARIDILKQVLKGGFPAHFVGNEVVSETLGDLRLYSRSGNSDEHYSPEKGTESPRGKPRGGKAMTAVWD